VQDVRLTVTISLIYNGNVKCELWPVDLLVVGRLLSTAWWQTTAEILEVEGHRETSIGAADNKHPGGVYGFRHGSHDGWRIF
jgi:hypothetical protein